MKRPYLGRVGAGALVAVAILALAGATEGSSTAPFHAQFNPDPVNNSVSQPGLADPAAPGPISPLFDQARLMVPMGRGAIQVPILMYHYIRENPVPGDKMGFDLSVTPADFNQQLDWLQSNGYHTVDFNDLRAYFDNQAPLPSRPVILTFDDGYQDLYTTAYPILRAHSFKGVAYLVSGFLGAPNNVSREQVVEMDGHGIQVGAHTVSHVDLTKAGDAELAHQVGDSRVDLEHLVGHPVVDFCYPSGRFDGRVAAAVKAAGFQTATTTQPGTQHSVADRFTWSRVRVSGGEGLDRFARDLSPQEPTVLVRQAARLPTAPSLPLVHPLLLPRLALQPAAELRPLP
jgi:peptidoglycan/xylan/chitin deacetylase (PgdA/CDA1 family)